MGMNCEENLLTIDECKEIQLSILKFIDKVCEENGLRYYLCGGTLIGAVRHRGYIPWDDDIDIMLPREDYRKLIEGAVYPSAPSCFPHRFWPCVRRASSGAFCFVQEPLKRFLINQILMRRFEE